jgi:hypothetical protein
VVLVVVLVVVVVVACDIAGPLFSKTGKRWSAVVPSASCDGNEELRIMLVIVRASG